MSVERLSVFRTIISVKDAALIAFTLLVFIVLNHAGSQIASGAAALGGLVGVLGHRLPPPKDWPAAVWAGGAFVIWCCLTSLWSSFEPERTLSGPIRFGLGAPLYALFVFVMIQQSQRAKTVWRWILVFLISLSALTFALDFASEFGITKLVDPNAKDGNIEQNLSHGLSVLLLLVPVYFVMLWKNDTWRKWLVGFVVFWVVMATFISGNFAASVALLGLTLAMAAAWKFPKLTVRLVFLIPILSILLAPFLGLFAMTITPEAKFALPFSWEWRLETWGYLGREIMAHPIIGSGFDSIRTFTETFKSRGYLNLPIVPMHAHNMGLHIWTETGLIGAVLASLGLWLSQRHIQQSPFFSRERTTALCGILTVAFVFSSLSYSAWHDWWLGAIFLALSFLALVPDRRT